MSFCVWHAAWNSYPSWRPSGMCARLCCHGNWHCQSTHSLPSSPSTPSYPWGKQERLLHTHTQTGITFKPKSIINTVSIHFGLSGKLEQEGQGFTAVTPDWFENCTFLDFWGFTFTDWIQPKARRSEASLHERVKNEGNGCCLYCDSVLLCHSSQILSFLTRV